MYKYYMMIVSFIFISLISSCDDVVDADKNIKITKLEYNSLKPNQEQDVILPLKEGNKWYYKVVSNNKDEMGTFVYVDSLYVVSGPTPLPEKPSEKWFIISYPFMNFAEREIYMANTDVGLWAKCNICESKSSLEAQYPITNNKYLASQFYYSSDYISDTLYQWTTSEQINAYETEIGKKNVIKYTTWYEGKKNQIKYPTPLRSIYFAPDFGIVKAETYNQNELESFLETTYTIIPSADFTDPNLIQKELVIDFGDVAAGTNKSKNIQLFENNTDKNIIIYDYRFFSQYGAKLDVDLNNIVLNKGSLLSRSLTITAPSHKGKFSGTFTIPTSNGEYYFVIKGVSI